MEKELHVTVVTLSGTHLAEHQGDGLVRDLKSLVAAAGGPPALLQRLMWEDRILKDEDTLESLGQGAVTVQMILESRLDVRRNLEALALPGKGKISADQLEALCEVCRDIFMSEPMLLEVPAPATVVGTLCGALDQLQHILATCGSPSSTRYVFLGSYVDRGTHGLETLALLLLHKVQYPDRLTMLRGKHECGSISRIYGFYDECKKYYNLKLWRSFITVFDTMPLCALIQSRVFCVPSGLSMDLDRLEQLNQIRRPTDVPDHGLLCDLLWADPDPSRRGFSDDIREGNVFGPDVVHRFMQQSKLDLICRAGLSDGGFEWFADTRMVSIFSQANYCGEFQNKGAVMTIDVSSAPAFPLSGSGPYVWPSLL